MTKKRTLRWIFGILAIACLAVIWGNSMTPGNESGQMSGSITEWINGVVQKIFPSFEISHMFVRKAAHFTEFAILGVLAAANMALWHSKRTSLFVLLAIPCCFLVALTDEFIQKFSAGRASSFADVLLDTSGAATAVLIFLACVVIRNALEKRSRLEA